MIYKLNVNDRVITHPHGDNLIQNGIESDSIQVTFDSEWGNLTSCRVVFMNGDDVIGLRVEMASPITIVIPWEVLKNPGRLFVSFVGYAEEAKRIVTQVMERPFCVVPSGRIDGNDAKKPTLDELQALINAVNSAEDVRSKSESTRVAAESARVSAENARKTSETARQTAETARVTEEVKRKSDESDRATDEVKRATAESARVSAENTRKSNETVRQTAERERVAADADRETKQAKNNADQLNNNLMSQANRYVKLSAEQYDHETGVPSIADPQQGITYLVPSPRQGTLNNYDGWAWLLDDSGAGAWELIGPANPTPDTVTTDDVDAAFSDAHNAGMRYVALNTLNYLAAKLKSLFAPKSHASTATAYGVSSASSYGHSKASQTTPKENGTAALGDETSSFARGDHVHPLSSKLATARSIELAGDVTGAAEFDGSKSISIAATIKALAVKAGMIADGAVTGAKLAAASVSRTKLDASLAQDIADLETAWDSVSRAALINRAELVDELTFDNLRSLDPGAYLVTNSAVGSPQQGSYGNMLIVAAEPTGYTPRVLGLIVFDNGACYGLGGWSGNLVMSRFSA